MNTDPPVSAVQRPPYSLDHHTKSRAKNQVRVDSLSFRRAFLEGYLLPHEYRACYGFAACVVLTVVMGLLLSREHQGWVGHLLWTGMLVGAFTFIPAAKWFGTYEVGRGGGMV